MHEYLVLSPIKLSPCSIVTGKSEKIQVEFRTYCIFIFSKEHIIIVKKSIITNVTLQKFKFIRLNTELIIYFYSFQKRWLTPHSLITFRHGGSNSVGLNSFIINGYHQMTSSCTYWSQWINTDI